MGISWLVSPIWSFDHLWQRGKDLWRRRSLPFWLDQYWIRSHERLTETPNNGVQPSHQAQEGMAAVMDGRWLWVLGIPTPRSDIRVYERLGRAWIILFAGWGGNGKALLAYLLLWTLQNLWFHLSAASKITHSSSLKMRSWVTTECRHWLSDSLSKRRRWMTRGRMSLLASRSMKLWREILG